MTDGYSPEAGPKVPPRGVSAVQPGSKPPARDFVLLERREYDVAELFELLRQRRADD